LAGGASGPTFGRNQLLAAAFAKSPDLDLNQIFRQQQQAYSDTRRCLDEYASEIAEFTGRKQVTGSELPEFPLIRQRRREKALTNSEKVMRMALTEITIRQRYSDRRYRASQLSTTFQAMFLVSRKTVTNLRRRYLHQLDLASKKGPRTQNK
jgi:hypothetical protein